jgi:hypothetical protein
MEGGGDVETLSQNLASRLSFSQDEKPWLPLADGLFSKDWNNLSLRHRQWKDQCLEAFLTMPTLTNYDELSCKVKERAKNAHKYLNRAVHVKILMSNDMHNIETQKVPVDLETFRTFDKEYGKMLMNNFKHAFFEMTYIIKFRDDATKVADAVLGGQHLVLMSINVQLRYDTLFNDVFHYLASVKAMLVNIAIQHDDAKLLEQAVKERDEMMEQDNS